MATINIVLDYDYVGEMQYLYLDDKIITWGDYDSGGVDLVSQVADALGITTAFFKFVDEPSAEKMGDPSFDFLKFSNVKPLVRPG